ncbi:MULTISPECIES: hypothetical protein [Pseudoalteromonas]|uniref:hypothetical protein n=1 Tax=Pseudoalteromonas TaxID=53246 RepID=UPI000785047D|nr:MULTISPECIES: hypothetical protein [Gammaproteobacteria]MCF7519360.1 hypothetical protein [Pseudoalteromonas sp. L21]UJX26880.1 hypothetical protein L3Q70_07055 [Pseudoalteromonas sp. CF6-2]
MEFKNHYGSVSIITEGSIIIGQFSGNINARLVNNFATGLKKHVSALAGRPWAYISHSTHLLATTPDAERSFANLFRALQGTNCIATAYMFSSSIVLNQMKRIIAEAEAPIQILDCLFDDLQSAKAYVLKQLEFAEMAC